MRLNPFTTAYRQECKPTIDLVPMIFSSKVLLKFVFFLASILIGSAGTYDDIFTVNKFKTGGDTYVIMGEKATLNGNKVLIDNIRVRLFLEKGEIYLFSPQCDFDQVKKMGYSEKSVHIRNENMTIDGLGFTLDIEQGSVLVRKNVKVKIYNFRNDLLGK